MRTQMAFTSMVLIVLLGCAATWPYLDREYVLDTQTQTLKAHNPKNDLPLKVCDSDDQIHDKCHVLDRETYRALRKDYQDMKKRLEACEAGPPPQ